MKSLALVFLCVVIGVTGFLLGRITAPVETVEVVIPQEAPPRKVIAAETVAPVETRNLVSGELGTSSPESTRVAVEEEEPGIANADPVTQLRLALDEPTERARLKAFRAALENFRSEDGPAGHQLFLDGDAKGRYFVPEWMDFWNRWGEVDPEGAYDYINSSGKLGDPQIWTSTGRVAPFIGYQGEEKARAFLGQLDLTTRQGSATAGAILSGLAEVDLDAATNIVAANTEAPFFSQVVDGMTEAAVQDGGIERLVSWYDTLPIGSPMREAALESTYRRLRRAGEDVANRLAEFAS